LQWGSPFANYLLFFQTACCFSGSFAKHRAKQIDALVGKTMYSVAQNATKKPHVTINKYLYIINK
jgi:hypothetical protein